MDDYFEALFGQTLTAEQSADHAAFLARCDAEEAERKANIARRAEEKIKFRCPRCAGEGRLSQFMHRNGGECFLCGGTGVFSGYSA